MTRFDPETDLTISRVIKAPRSAVWSAWTTPSSLEQWWVPAPARCKVLSLELRPGGAFVTQISDNGAPFGPHLDASFLDVEHERRIVFTDVLRAGFRPAPEPFMAAILTFQDHPQGTEYVAHVMHRNNADRNTHEQLGFYDGWGTVAAQLAKFVER